MRTEAQIQKLTDGQAKSLIRLYEKGEARIEKQINAALLRGSDPAYLRQVQENITTARKELLAGSRTWCEKSVPYLYREGVAYADEMAFSSHLSAGFGTVHQQAANALAEATYGRFQDVDGVIGRRVDDLFRAIQLESAEGTVLGHESAQQSAKVMREELAKKGITGFVDKAGRQWSMQTYTKMCTHQVAMDSFREGTRLRLLEHGYDLAVFSTHSSSCPLCVPWQGVTVSLTGKTKGYRTLADARGAGMLHVGCRHVYTLSSEETEDKTYGGGGGSSPPSKGALIKARNDAKNMMDQYDRLYHDAQRTGDKNKAEKYYNKYRAAAKLSRKLRADIQNAK